MTMTWSTTVSRMVWRASSDPLITWAVQVGAGGAVSSVDAFGWVVDLHVPAPVEGFGGSISGDSLTSTAAYDSLGITTGEVLLLSEQTDPDDDGLWVATGRPYFERGDQVVTADHVGQLVTAALDVAANASVVMRITAAPALEYLYVTEAAIQYLIDATVEALPAAPTLPYLNVADFGAVGDGSADDTEAFEDAIAELPEDGGAIYVPPGTYMVRRPISLPSITELFGVRGASIIKKVAGLKLTVTGGDTAGSTSITVSSATGLAVGDALVVESEGNGEWASSHVVVTGISGTTVSFAPALAQTYSGGANRRAFRTFPLIQNVGANTEDGTQDEVKRLRVHDLTLDQNWTSGQDEDRGAVTYLNFTVSTIHWDKVRDSVVERVDILNACSDGYSDQARGGTGNTIQDCKIESPMRYGIHLGTTMLGGGKALRNTVVDAGNPSRLSTGATDNVGAGFFYCADVVGTLVEGNTFEDCWGGFYGGDNDGGDHVYGDQANRIIGNRIAGQIAGSTARAIEPGWKAIVADNIISGWRGGAIRLRSGCSDSVVQGNTIGLIAAGTGIEVLAKADRPVITGNLITQTGTGDASNGITLTGVDDGVVVDNLISGVYNGITLDGCNRIECENTISSHQVYGYQFNGSASADVAIRTRNGTYFNIVNEGTLSNCTRLLINGVGENGENDPASAGDWYTATSTSVSHTKRWFHHGAIVHWTSGSGTVHRWSVFNKVSGNNPGVWRELTNEAIDAAKVTSGTFDRARIPTPASSEMQTVLDIVLGSNGDWATALAALPWSTYTDFELYFTGRSASTAAGTDGIRIDFGSGLGSVYGHNASALTSAFNNVGSFAASQTNANRSGFVRMVFAQVASGVSHGEVRSGYMNSTASVGTAMSTNAVYFTGTLSAAIAVLRFYTSSGASFAAGSRLTVKARTAP